MIIDESDKYELEGAVALVWENENIPEEYTISYTNLAITWDDDDNEVLILSRGSWGWSGPGGFSSMFSTKEDALKDLLHYLGIKGDPDL